MPSTIGSLWRVAVPDGVYTVANNSGNETATANFHPLAQPTQRDLDAITHNVNARVCAWLKRKGFLQNESESECNDAEAQPSALHACLVALLGVGELVSVRSAEGQLPEDCPARPAKAARRPGSSNGFNLALSLPAMIGPGASDYCATARARS